MSDFGEQASNTTVTAFSKMLDTLSKIIQALWKAHQEAPERKLKKMEMKELRWQVNSAAYAKQLSTMRGQVNYKKLMDSTLPKATFVQKLTDKDFNAFKNAVNREGMIFGAVRNNNVDEFGRREYSIICLAQDRPRMQELTLRLNDEKTVALIDERLAEIDAAVAENGGVWEKEQIEEAEELKGQRAEIVGVYSDELNQKQGEAIFDKAINGDSSTVHGVAFDKALDRYTSGSFDTAGKTVLVAASDPDKYIVCDTKVAEFEDEKYLRTEYEVFNHGESKGVFDDGRFEGRQPDYWQNCKEQMAASGEFPKDAVLMKFDNPETFARWQEAAKRQNEQEISTDMAAVGERGRNYGGMIKKCEAQLEERGFMYDHQEGIVKNKETGEPVVSTQYSLSSKEGMDAAELRVIGRQIGSYEKLQNFDADCTVAYAEMKAAQVSGNAKQAAAAQGKYEATVKVYGNAVATEQTLLNTRKRINSVQANDEVKTEIAKDTLNKEVIIDTASGKEVVPEVAKGERREEKGEIFRKFSDYKSRIQDKMARDGAKKADRADKGFEKSQDIRVSAGGKER